MNAETFCIAYFCDSNGCLRLKERHAKFQERKQAEIQQWLAPFPFISSHGFSYVNQARAGVQGSPVSCRMPKAELLVPVY